MRKCLLISAVMAAFVLALGAPAGAVLINVPGFSFESPDLADGTNNISRANTHVWDDGWTSADNNKNIAYGAGVEDPITDLPGQVGGQYAKMKFIYNSNNQWIKMFSPTLDAVKAGTTYTFSVAAAYDKQYGGGQQPTWNPQASYNHVSLYFSGLEFYLVHGALTQNSFADLSFQVVIGADGKLVSHTATSGPAVGTLLTGGNLSVKFMGGRALNSGGTGISYLMFDNVRVDDGTVPAAVPEPAGLGLIGVALLAVARRRRA